MIAMRDRDHSGKLGFEEFLTLFTDIRKWRDIFKLYDLNNTGKLSPFKLRSALSSAGFRLNNKILNALAHRYGSNDGMILFEDFIMCAIKMQVMTGMLFLKYHILDLYINAYVYITELFIQKIRDNNTNIALFSMNEWVENVLYS